VKLKTVRLVAIESSLKHFPIDLYLWNECKIRTFVIKIKYISFFLHFGSPYTFTILFTSLGCVIKRPILQTSRIRGITHINIWN